MISSGKVMMASPRKESNLPACVSADDGRKSFCQHVLRKSHQLPPTYCDQHDAYSTRPKANEACIDGLSTRVTGDVQHSRIPLCFPFDSSLVARLYPVVKVFKLPTQQTLGNMNQYGGEGPKEGIPDRLDLS
eukprot:12409277-Karenia_brevis.AAC.1